MENVCYIRYKATGITDIYAMPHAHDNDFEIFQPLDNNGKVIIKNKIYPMQKGALYFIDGINSHCPSPEDVKSYKRNIIIFSRSYYTKLFGMLDSDFIVEKMFLEDGGSFCPLSEVDAEFAKGIFEKMSLISREDEFANLKLLKGLTTLLELGYKNKDVIIKKARNVIDKILDYTEKNLRENISLEEISDKFHISKYYLCHIFKKQTGLTVTEYIYMRRIAVAKTLLCTTDKSMGEIAAECGFNSQAYFGKKFLISEGQTPGEFRKNNKF